MNRTYRLVWSQLSNTWIAVAENVKGRGKSISGRRLIATAIAIAALGPDLTTPAYAANAADATVTAGQGNVKTVGNTTTINQQSQNLAIDWTGLSTAANEALIFNQPNSSAIALNRITGASPSALLGSLTANGQVFILNPNGVLFGAGAQVNVGGLVASTLGMSNTDLEEGRFVLTANGNGNASVVNQGTINAADGAYVALVAATVRNEGTINARLGTALLAAGNQVTLNINNGSLLGYSINQGALNALAENKQLIQANGGQVLMSAKALNNLTTAVVNNTGLIEAKTIQNKSGRIMLMGDMEVGTVNVGGKLDASAATTGDGGFIETSAAHVKISDDALITTKAASGVSGSWLIDPVDFTVAASGGDITGKALATQLANNGLVTILNTQGANGTQGDININDSVSWSSNSVLALNAQRNININAAVTATGDTAGLKLTYGGDYKVKAPVTLSGSNSTLNINGNAYTLIRSMAQLDLLDGNNSVTNVGTARQLNGYYALAQDLDAAGTTYTRSLLGGSSSTTFIGTFAGMGHTISNLTVNTTAGAGLFALIGAGSVVRDLGMVGGNIYGANGDVGAITGRNTGGTIENVYATGVTVGGTSRTGGLVGYLNGGTVSNSYANVTVSNGNSVGGLVGTSAGSISNSYAEGEVNGLYVGGLVGSNNAGATISQSYATGKVNGITGSSGSRAGGLVGLNLGSISYAYATGAVTADSLAGGLVGLNSNSGSINNAYASGNVTLVANANVPDPYAGGLIGFDAAATTNAVWDSSSSGHVAYTGSNGSAINTTDVNTANRYQHSAYGVLGNWQETAAGSGVWIAYDGSNNPQWVMVDGSTRPLLYSEWSTHVGNAHQLQLMAANLSANYILSKNIDLAATNGSNASGIWNTTGFASIGNGNANFTGTLDGKGYTVSNLHINRASTDYTGLFGAIGSGSSVQNVGVISGSVSGKDFVGGLVGYNNGGAINNAYASLQVSGARSVGGLAGVNEGSISHSYADGVTSGSTDIGGLVGSNVFSISDSYAAGTVNATGTFAGGLAGWQMTGSSITGSYATTNVSGYKFAGGLVGYSDGAIANSYTSGTVSGEFAGGLVAYNASFGTIANSYGNSTARGSGGDAGLAALNSGSITHSFWNAEKTGRGIAFGNPGDVTGITSAQAQQASTFVNAGWDIGTSGGTNTVWRIYDGQSGPLLRSFLKAVTVTTAASDKTYDGTTNTAATYTAIPGVTLNGSVNYVSSKNAGSYSSSAGTLSLSGLYSDQQGYDISYADATLTINKANLTVTANSASKTYDGTTAASGSATVGALAAAGDQVSSNGSLAFADKNAGSGKTIIASGVTIEDATHADVTANYNINYVNNNTGFIDKAALSVKANDASKSLDTNAYAGGNGVTLSGLAQGDSFADLQGVLAYGGSAQGAKGAGNYVLTANGLSSSNYVLTFVDGTLRIQADVASGASGIAAAQLPAYNSALLNGRSDFSQSSDGKDEDLIIAVFKPQAEKNDAADASRPTPRLNISSCGMQLPPDAASSACQ